jgi:hypothetical protein
MYPIAACDDSVLPPVPPSPARLSSRLDQAVRQGKLATADSLLAALWWGRAPSDSTPV